MVSVEERMKVLNLLQTGAITPEQAAQLLQAMDTNRPAPAASEAPPVSYASDVSYTSPVSEMPAEAPSSEARAWDNAPAASTPFEPAAPSSIVSAPPPPPTPSGQRAHWLHVRVSDMRTGRPRVNVRLPLSLVGFGLKMGRQFAPEMKGMDINELTQVLQMGEPGPYVDVYDEEDNEHVEVFLE